MNQKLTVTNPIEIIERQKQQQQQHKIKLDDILPTRATATTTTKRKIATALVATTATTNIKPLNLDFDVNVNFDDALQKQSVANKTKPTTTTIPTTIQRNENAMMPLTGILTGNSIQQQLTTLLIKAATAATKMETATPKTPIAYDAFSYLNNYNNKNKNNITFNDVDDTYQSVSAFASTTNPSVSNTYTTITDFTSIISSSGPYFIASTTSSSLPLSLSLASSSSTITLPLDENENETVTASSLIGIFADVATATTSATATTNMSMISANSIVPSLKNLLGLAWPKALIVAIFLLLILITIVGNTLVILAVLTTRRLRTVTNCFVMNLAITDWLVGTCVMPPAVLLYCTGGSWQFGWILCDIWISLDVLLCTGSILSLCAISLDRYLAVTQPLTYSKKRRSKRLALFMIFIVWISALSITCPPFFGWYEPGRRKDGNVVCRYNQNKGYVVFSAMGSFFIPLAVMMYVYLKIGYVLTSRRQRIVRDANSERTADHEIDCDNFLSESEHFQCATSKFPSLKTRWTINGFTSGNGSSKRNSLQNCEKCNSNHLEQVGLRHQTSFYELVEISRLSSLIHCSAVSCKYGGPCMHTTPLSIKMANSDRNGNSKSNNNGTNGTNNIANGGGSNVGEVKHNTSNTLPKFPTAALYNETRASFSESCLTTAMTTTTQTATALQQNVKFNDELHQQNHKQHENHHTQNIQNNHHHHHHHHQQQQQQKQHHHHHHNPHRIPMRISTTKRDTKTTKTLTIVMGGFVVCWLPFFVYYLLIPFLPPAAVIEGLQTFLTWVGWVNCAINPFIYAFYNPDFRLAFWRLTCRRICKQKQPSNHMAMFRG